MATQRRTSLKDIINQALPDSMEELKTMMSNTVTQESEDVSEPEPQRKRIKIRRKAEDTNLYTKGHDDGYCVGKEIGFKLGADHVSQGMLTESDKETKVKGLNIYSDWVKRLDNPRDGAWLCTVSNSSDLATRTDVRICLERDIRNRMICLVVRFNVGGFDQSLCKIRELMHNMPFDLMEDMRNNRDKLQNNITNIAVALYRQMNVFYAGVSCLCHVGTVVALFIRESQMEGDVYKNIIKDILREVANEAGMPSDILVTALKMYEKEANDGIIEMLRTEEARGYS